MALECVVSKPDIPSEWFKDDEKIEPSDRVSMTVDGPTHTLALKEADVEDEAEYIIKLGNLSSNATILINGKNINAKVEMVKR